MKTTVNIAKSVAIVLLSAFASVNVTAQSACATQMISYAGPKSTTELETRLYESGNSILQNLSTEMKEALLEHVVFRNEMPRGFNADTPDQLTELAYNNGPDFLSAVFNCQVILCTNSTRPTVTDISYDDFMNLYNSNPDRYTSTTVMVWCENCVLPVPAATTCCEVGGKGCEDNVTMTAMYQELFHVIISQ